MTKGRAVPQIRAMAYPYKITLFLIDPDQATIVSITRLVSSGSPTWMETTPASLAG